MTEERRLVEVERWAIRGDFSPISSKQVLTYCQARRYPVPKHRKTHKPTTNDEALSRILQKVKDPVLISTLRSRHLKKAAGYLYDTYLGKDGRLHPLFTDTPKTGRLSSKAPNVMNLPQGRKGDVMAEAAQAIREAFIPPPGWLLAEFDWKNIEALLVGYFAGDEDYMRLSRLGSHAYFTSFGIGKPADLTKSDGELLDYFDWIKRTHPEEYAKYKKANLSNNYGIGIRNMARDLGITEAECKVIRDTMDQAAPKVAAWKDRVRRQAHAQGYLENPFGYRLTFFEVFRWEEGGWVLGGEANEVLAYPAQSSGAAMLRYCLVELGEDKEEGDTFIILIPTHDSILIAVQEPHLERIINKTYFLMTREWPELGGLRVEVEVKVGKDMRDLKGWRI